MEFGMEAKALKSSVRGELAMHKTQQHAFDDFLYRNVMNGGVPSEDFSVDCFFDFTNGELEDGSIEEEEEEEEEEEKLDSVSVSSQERTADDDNSNSCSFYFGSILTNELSVPDDEIAGLEWVSHFVDDSFPEFPSFCPVSKQQSENHAKTPFEAEPEPVFVKTPCFTSAVPSKARSKRAKPTSRTWLIGSMPLSESSSSTTTTTTSSSSTSSGFSMTSTTTVQNMELANDVSEPPKKKHKKKPAAVQASGSLSSSSSSSGNPFQRRCSHCQVQKTPQWRTGPLGPKTLCNACGVRYKSGRLFPEYRPACSPTFSTDMHSNSHRKVLEMRKKKELAAKEPVQLTRMVPSF